MKINRKKLLFSLVLLILVVCFIEAASFAFFNAFKNRFTFYEFEKYLFEGEHIKYYHQRYDPLLGWDNRYNTRFGERPRHVNYNNPLIATFGDSFTHCDEVYHHETWQAYLSSLLERDVYNFGVGGYGTDQSYLNYLSKYPQVNTPIVTLGFIPENINRIVSVYRPFYYLKTGLRLTKPRYKLENGALILLDNPVRNKKEIEKLKSPKFLLGIGKNDWWFNKDNYPILRFPYSKILLNKRMWLEIFYGEKNREIDDTAPRPWENLWEEEEASHLMFTILDAFVNDAKNKKATPIIMILPPHRAVLQTYIRGENTENVSKILEFCSARQYYCFNAVAALAESVTSRRDIRLLYGRAHVSAMGNQIIAEKLFDYINNLGIKEK